MSDPNNLARQPGADQLGQVFCKDAVDLTETAATEDASSEEMTIKERNKKNALAGAQGEDTESLLMDRLTEVEETCVRLEGHINLLDRLGELKATAVPSPFKSKQGFGTQGMEEQEISVDEMAIESTTPAAEGPEDGAPAQEEDSNGIELSVILYEPADLESPTRCAYEQPAEADGDSSSLVTSDKDRSDPVGQETEILARTEDDQPVVMVAGNETPIGPPSITATTEAVIDTATEDLEVLKVKEKSTKIVVEDMHKETQEISRELKEKYNESMKELEKTREILEASYQDLAGWQEWMKQLGNKVFRPLVLSRELHWHAVDFFPLFTRLIEDIETHHNALDRLHTLESDVDLSFSSQFHGKAQSQFSEWPDGVQLELLHGTRQQLTIWFRELYLYQSALLSYLDCLRTHMAVVDELVATSPRNVVQGLIKGCMARPKIEGESHLRYLEYCTTCMADMAREMVDYRLWTGAV